MLSNRPDYGRTFTTAMWTVGLVAAIQLFAVAKVFLSDSDSVTGTQHPGPVPVGQGSLFVAPGGDAILGAGANPGAPQENQVRPLNPLSSPQGIPDVPGGDYQQGTGGQGNFRLPGPTAGPGEGEMVNPSMMLSASPDLEAISVDGGFSNSPVLPEPTFYGPADAGPGMSETLANAALTAERIEDPMLERLVSAGEELRSKGNMPSALQALRNAEQALPNHPRVLGEIAATLSQMGQAEKADIYWKKLVDLGPALAGGYHELAQKQLAGEMSTSILSDPDNVMKIGEVKVDATEPGSGGQKVTVRVVIDADPALRPDGDQSALLVYFYDLVDGQRIDASTADTSYLYPTKPYDWQTDGTEEISVIYDQPVFTEEQQRELGNRRYYGYAIELYYRDRLQDRVVMPEDILQHRMEEVNSESDTEPRTFGPENALFPDALNF